MLTSDYGDVSHRVLSSQEVLTKQIVNITLGRTASPMNTWESSIDENLNGKQVSISKRRFRDVYL